MQYSFVAFEAMLFALFAICATHAYKKGRAYISELIVAAVYGVLLEFLTIIQLHYYSYGNFFIKIGGVPIAVGLGWAVIIYTSMATADKLEISEKTKPFLAALLALNIDISMDAIAIREGFWKWGVNGEWFGVPLGNFFAWFIVVFSFSLLIYYFRKTKKLENFYPIPALVVSVLALLGLDAVWVYFLPQTARIIVLAGMLIFSAVIVFMKYEQINKNNKFDWKIFSVPLGFHVFFLLLILFRPYRIPALVLISFLMLVFGLYVHLVPSLKAQKF